MQSPALGLAPAPTVALTAEMAHLLDVYRSGIATWQDLFDYECSYQGAVSRRVLTSELILRCVCAFTAKHLSLLVSGEIWASAAARYYGESLRMLIELFRSPVPQDDALTATILLCSYEVMAAAGQEHRRHVFGAMMLIKTHGVSARSIGLDRANFWIFVRHDITTALMNEKPVLISAKDWNISWRDGEINECMLGNRILCLTARAVDLVFSKDPTDGQLAGTENERTVLVRDVRNWFSALPSSFHGVEYGEATEEGFSRLYFAVPAAAAAMMWYHVIYILLYAETGMQGGSQCQEVQHHAKQIANIAISNFPDSVRVFSAQPLYYAAKHIRGLAQKARIWSLLEHIETRLGFHTRSRVKNLQELAEAGL